MILFEITHDCLFDGVGTGMKGYKYHDNQVFGDSPRNYRFKLLDDGGIVYFRGRCCDEAWEDLMDWGTWYAGCTEVWGRKGNDKYEMIIG